MTGGDQPSRAGRITALATLLVSAAMFAFALFGIASIDPNADAASPAGRPSIHNVSLDEQQRGTHHRRDCPFKKHDRSKSRNGDAAADDVSS
jgi:hypothetical protein